MTSFGKCVWDVGGVWGVGGADLCKKHQIGGGQQQQIFEAFWGFGTSRCVAERLGLRLYTARV